MRQFLRVISRRDILTRHTHTRARAHTLPCLERPCRTAASSTNDQAQIRTQVKPRTLFGSSFHLLRGQRAHAARLHEEPPRSAAVRRRAAVRRTFVLRGVARLPVVAAPADSVRDGATRAPARAGIRVGSRRAVRGLGGGRGVRPVEEKVSARTTT